MKKLLIGVLALALLSSGGWVAWEVAQPYRGNAINLLVLIPPGSGAQDISQKLVDRGVLAYQIPFLLRYWLGSLRGRTLKAGEYQFDHPLSPNAVYWKLARGEVYLHAIVIPEGSDRFDMARILSAEVGTNPQEFLAATARPGLVRDLDPQAPSLEGYLFPDTYLLPRGAPARRIVGSMLSRFRRVAQLKLGLTLNPPPGNLHNVMTMASLVERETPNPQERPLIAGVFTRRLKKDMPLQSDPTVVYALRLIRGFPDFPTGAPTHTDLSVDSPYNTYAHAGLPPGPICSPGEASIQAALHPAAGDALYFVSNNHGGHYFAPTLAAHQRNVTRYRRQLNGSTGDQTLSPPQSAAAKTKKGRKVRQP